MSMEPKVKKKLVVCEILGRKAEITVSDETPMLCKSIENEARDLLNEIKEDPQSDNGNMKVVKFLKKSIEAVGGSALIKDFEEKETSVAEFSGVLCCIISALREFFAENTEA